MFTVLVLNPEYGRRMFLRNTGTPYHTTLRHNREGHYMKPTDCTRGGKCDGGLRQCSARARDLNSAKALEEEEDADDDGYRTDG